LSNLQLLERYLISKDVEDNRIALLLERAEQFFATEN
jgi:hypothetical protein